ncbi:hypothetical protein [Yoonia sp. R2-816]|uniref:hypothetical protein n=1 Tax=Yoonia sp. R2-816 TaxID=3342638 RepID=UPI00372909E1
MKKTAPELPAHAIIKNALRQNGLKLFEVAENLGESPSKVSLAIHCTSGVGPKPIETRKKIARFLGLDPYEVWDASFLTPKPRQKGGNRKVKRRMEYTKDDWAALVPKDKVRSILAEFDTTVQDLSSILDIPYSTLTSAIYGNFNSDARLKIAEHLAVAPEKIWPELHSTPVSSVDFEAQLRLRPDLRKMYGFGDMRVPFSPQPVNPEQTDRATTVRKNSAASR